MIKYPRTLHLPWSESKTDDDKTLKDVSCFKGMNVVVTLKMDGENTTIYNDGYYHARSITQRWSEDKEHIRQFAEKFKLECDDEPEDLGKFRIVCENMYAQHSIEYKDLDSYIYVLSYWYEESCADWDSTVRFVRQLNKQGLSCCQPKVIYEGIFDEKAIKKSFEPYAKDHEGYVIRNRMGFDYDQFSTCVAKYVRKNHIQTDNNWGKQIKVNGLKND